MTLELLPRHKYRLDGLECPGVTTIIGKGVPAPALINWAAEQSAAYAVDHWDELATLGVVERAKRIEKARFTTRDKAAVDGTRVHAFAQRLALGERVDVPEPLAGYVDSYLRFVDDWQPREVLLEAAVLNRRFWYAGRLDLIAQLVDERDWLLDFKTTRSGVYSEAALQLAAYRYAEAYIDAAGLEQPLPSIEQAGVVWLQPNAYELVPVDTSDEAFAKFLYVKQVAGFVDLGRDRWVDEPLTPPLQGQGAA